MTHDALVVRTPDGRFRDCHLLAADALDSMDQIRERRAIARDAFRQILDAETFVITLGLNEMWHEPGIGALNSWSDLTLLEQKPSLEVRVLSVAENLSNLEKIYFYLSSIVSNPRIVLTVSPVPLYATFTSDDVVVANTRSKAILRAAAEEFAARHSGVCYFPSYEISMFSAISQAFETDLRHVTRGMVAHIVALFESTGV